jgi:thiol:disulfide interchange protein DsbD
MKHIRTILLVIYLPIISNLGVYAIEDKHVNLQLISEVQTIQPGRPFWVAVHFDIEEEWHIYWRTPGDAGMAPSFEWHLPPDFRVGDIQWPYPKRIILSTLANFGYENEVLLMSEITPPDVIEPGSEFEIGLHVDMLVCKEECLPAESDLMLQLAVSNAIPDFNARWMDKFAETRNKIPLPNPGWEIEAIKEDTIVAINARMPDWFSGKISGLSFFPFSSEILQNAAQQRFSVTSDGFKLNLLLSPSLLQSPERISGILVADEGWRGAVSEKAITIDLPVKESATSKSGQEYLEIGSIWLALFFAFVGGMILNLMPCVLPVLSLKILGFIQQAGDERQKIVLHGLIFTLGVLVSFLMLATILIILRAGGEQLGWGFQLQSPNFIFILSIFFFLFALSLFGVFEIGISLTGVGSQTGGKPGRFGTFLSGVTATVVATPCTAPFMGSALGYALSQPAFYAMLIFSALGLGMATPYLLLSFFPALLKFVPKPGAWMETLKQFMGFLLAGTVIWLIWVLGIQSGLNTVAITLISLLLIAISAWIFGRWGNIGRAQRTRILAMIASSILIIATISFGILFIATANQEQIPTASNYKADGIKWEPFAEERLQELKQTQNAIFIDFTAAWCLSCQVNERVAFGSREVQQKFKDLDIIALKADWTSRDEEITKSLASYGRNSVPLYVLYGKEKKEVIILPEIITPGIVLQALEKIK